MIKSKIYSADSSAEENSFDLIYNPSENVNLNYTMRSPLRYPGGKTRAIECITSFFPKNLDKTLKTFPSKTA